MVDQVGLRAIHMSSFDRINLTSKEDSVRALSILLYHQVGHEPKSGTNLSCFCRVDRFLQQMRYLKESGYSVISLSRAYESLYGNNPILPESSVVLTFDDGDISFPEAVVQVLREFEYPATVFAVPGLLGQQTNWMKVKAARVPVMSPSQLREVHALGVEIGSHSLSHRCLSRLSHSEMVNEVRDSKDRLETMLESEIHAFAYPHGDHNAIIVESVRKAGYRCAVTCEFADAGSAVCAHAIPRKYITFDDDLVQFKSKLPPLAGKGHAAPR